MIRILVVANIRLFRDGLAEALARRAAMQVVGTAASGEDALRRLAELGPSVVLMDQAVPQCLSAIREIIAQDPAVKVIALGEPEGEQGVLAFAAAGVAGYVARDGSLDDLAATLESVHRGEFLCSPQVAATLLKRVASWAAAHRESPVRGRLTVRESEIVRLIDDGLSNKEIAARLGIEVATVKNHVHNLLEKLQVHRRADAVDRVREPDLRRPRAARLKVLGN